MNWRKKMLRVNLARVFRAPAMCVLFAAVVAGALAPSARAQTTGSRKDDVVLNARGLPLAGATIRVCTSAATGEPCSPLAQIYSDQALTQALANPTTSDGMGNYTFYAAPGRYVIEISGPNITTRQLHDVILPNDPSAPTFTSLTTTSGINAFTLTLSGNLTVAGSAAITGALTVNGGPVPSTAAANTWTASQIFKGPNPWRDVQAFGAVPDGTTDSTTAFNNTIAAACNDQNGVVNISYGAHAYFLAGSLTFPCQNLVILQANTIQTAHKIVINQNSIHWTGIAPGGGNPGISWDGYKGPPLALILAKTLAGAGVNDTVINIHGTENVTLENLGIASTATDAHDGILVDSITGVGGAVDTQLINVASGMFGTGTGVPLRVDESAFGLAFGLRIRGGAYNAGVNATDHASIVIRDIGFGYIDDLHLENYGIKMIADSAAVENFLISNVLVEGLYDDFLVLENDSPFGDEVGAIKLINSGPADNNATIYYLRGQGTQTIGSVVLSMVNGANNIVNPAGAQPIGGLFTDSTPGTLPAGTYGSLQNGTIPQYLGMNISSPAFDIARGVLVAGAAQNGSGTDCHHFIDSVNGGNSIIYNSLPNSGASCVARFDSAGSFPYVTFETPNGGSFYFRWGTPGGGFAAYQFANSSNGEFGFQTSGGVTQTLTFWPTATGNLLAGDAVASHRLVFGAGAVGQTNFGAFAAPVGGFTGPRVLTAQDASGTIAFTAQLPLAGTTSSIGGGSLAAGACTTGTASVASSTTSMAVEASPAADPGTGFTWNAFVSAAGTVTVRVCNVSGASATPAATAFNVRVIQ
jgi:hypothetical protein